MAAPNVPTGALLMASGVMDEPSGKSLPAAEENANPLKGDISPKTLWGMITGGIGVVVGYLGGQAYATLKMLKFENEYLGDARKDFMGRSGVGAGAAEGLGADVGMANGLGGLGRGMASHEITEFHRLKLINSGKHPFPRMLEVIGGKGGFALLTGAAAGVVAFLGYQALAPRKPAQPEALPAPDSPDWQARIVTPAEQPTAQRTPGV